MKTKTDMGVSPEVPEWLDELAWEDLRSLLDEWRASKRLPIHGETIPMFKGPRRNTGIHCSKELLQRVQARIDADKAGTGGSLSKLCEFLLWRFIGSPEDLIERPPSQEPPVEG